MRRSRRPTAGTTAAATAPRHATNLRSCRPEFTRSVRPGELAEKRTCVVLFSAAPGAFVPAGLLVLDAADSGQWRSHYFFQNCLVLNRHLLGDAYALTSVL